jgi:hypothetical protein
VTEELAVASQHPVSHFLFHQGIFCQKAILPLSPTTLLFSLSPQLKIKLKGHRFDTIEVIEAGSQVVLNTLTEHDFQDAFKKWQKRWEQCICAEGEYFEVNGVQWAKI